MMFRPPPPAERIRHHFGAEDHKELKEKNDREGVFGAQEGEDRLSSLKKLSHYAANMKMEWAIGIVSLIIGVAA
jgi:hypothetical protein